VRRCPLVPLALLLVLGGPPQADAGPSDARAALAELVRGVEVRRGIQHRSLVVVALVAREPCDDPDAGPACSTAGLAWAPDEGRVEVVAANAAEDRVVPTGTLLREGPRERVTAYPLVLTAGAGAHVEAIRVPSGLDVAADAVRTFAGLAGPEARHVVTIAPHPDALGELLELERFLAGLPDGDVPGPLAAIRDAPRVTTARAAGAKALARLATAYGGETRGYVAFLGHRPVEVVVSKAASTHADRWRAAVDGLATHGVLWEELYGRTGEPVEPVDWTRVLEVTARLLDQVGKAGVRRSPDATRWRLRSKSASRLGWLQLDEDGQALLLEAWPLGDTGPFPVPARGPGGKPVDERPDSILQGTLTREFLERFLERLDRIRRGLGLR